MKYRPLSNFVLTTQKQISNLTNLENDNCESCVIQLFCRMFWMLLVHRKEKFYELH